MACYRVIFELYRKKPKLRLCENRMFRKIFGFKSEEVAGG